MGILNFLVKHLSTSFSLLTLMPCVIRHFGDADPPGSPATLSPASGFRPVALRPTLSSGLPFSSFYAANSSDYLSKLHARLREKQGMSSNPLICLKISNITETDSEVFKP